MTKRKRLRKAATATEVNAEEVHPGGIYTRTTWEKAGRRLRERGLGTVDGEESDSVYWLNYEE